MASREKRHRPGEHLGGEDERREEEPDLPALGRGDPLHALRAQEQHPQAEHEQAEWKGRRDRPQEHAPRYVLAGSHADGVPDTVVGMPQLAPGTMIGGYRIEAVAGRGGMGVVYRATQLRLNRPVALKVIADELAEDPGF